MKIQSCLFKRNKKSEFEVGIAFLSPGFSVSDVKFIIDKNGNKIRKIWNYDLFNTPLSCIDTGCP